MLKVKPKEIWKLINNYPDYKVSNLGRVKRFSNGRNIRNNNTFSGKILKPIKKRKGYLVVTIYVYGRKTRKQVGISRLVAETFLGPRPDGYEINHKSGIKKNNSRYNLEYITQLENHRHAGRLGLSGYKLTEKDVKHIRYLYADGYGSQDKIAKEFGISQMHVGNIIRGKRW